MKTPPTSGPDLLTWLAGSYPVTPPHHDITTTIKRVMSLKTLS